MSESKQSEQAIFDAVLALLPAERAPYLARATQGDEALRHRLEALLSGYEHGDYLEEGVGAGLRGNMASPIRAREKPGDRIGRYRLLQKIGEGGCGAVYLAEQTEPVTKPRKPGKIFITPFPFHGTFR